MNTAFRQDFRVVVQGLLDVNRGAMSLLVHVARRPSSHDQIIALQSLASSAAPLLGTMTSLVVVGGNGPSSGRFSALHWIFGKNELGLALARQKYRQIRTNFTAPSLYIRIVKLYPNDYK